MILLNIVIAAILMAETTAIHAGGMIMSMRLIRHQEQRGKHTQVCRISGVVLLMFLVSLVEVMSWAAAYLLIGAIEGLEKAIYFSMVTFTTLGYGDLLLDERWRLLGSFEAANGIIMFGWTTAVVMAVVHKVYFNEKTA